jgi:hypothetical protein
LKKLLLARPKPDSLFAGATLARDAGAAVQQEHRVIVHRWQVMLLQEQA